MRERCRICGTTLPQRDGRCAVCGDPGGDGGQGEQGLYSPGWWAVVAAARLQALTHAQGVLEGLVARRDAEVAEATDREGDPHAVAEQWDGRIQPLRDEVRRLHEEWLAARDWAGRTAAD